MNHRLTGTCCAVLVALVSRVVVAGPAVEVSRPARLSLEQEEALVPGLIARFEQVHEGIPVRDARAARLAAVHVPAGTPPTPFLRPGPFRALLDGYLLVELNGEFRFSLEGSGRASLEINGTQLLGESERRVAREPSVPVVLHQGHNRLRLVYESPDSGVDATLRLKWSSSTFPLEPLPPTLLVHDGRDAQLAQQTELRSGRELLATRNCVRCHGLPSLDEKRTAMPELFRDNPSLANVGNRIRPTWVFHWILNPTRLRNNTTMPKSLGGGEEARRRAADIATYLAGLADQELSLKSQAGDDLIGKGEVLFEDLGCISCHTFAAPDVQDAFTRTSLHFVSSKYQPGALDRYLLKPHEHYAWNRMPGFALTEEVAGALVAFIQDRSRGQLAEVPELGAADAERGREAFQRQCAACHATNRDQNGADSRTEGTITSPSTVPPPHWGDIQGGGNTEVIFPSVPSPRQTSDGSAPPLFSAAGNLERGCLATDGPARGRAPEFAFSAEQRRALAAFARTGGPSLGRTVMPEAAGRYVAALDCIRCHSRDAESSWWPDVLAEEGVQGTPPATLPHLTWAGEKLQVIWMERLFSGRLPYKPRPWIAAQMPTFPVRAKELALGLAAEHGFDATPRVGPRWDEAKADVGRQLIERERGFFCVECHAVGEKPAAGAFSHHGVNFSHVSERLQYDYYRRWITDPVRVDPASKMPKFSADGVSTPNSTFYGGDAQRQFEALWHYLRSLPGPQR